MRCSGVLSVSCAWGWLGVGSAWGAGGGLESAGACPARTAAVGAPDARSWVAGACLACGLEFSGMPNR